MITPPDINITIIRQETELVITRAEDIEIVIID